jgi:hypothetical protein
MAKNNRTQRNSLLDSPKRGKKKTFKLTKKTVQRLLKIGFSIAHLVLKLVEVAEKIQGFIKWESSNPT